MDELDFALKHSLRAPFPGVFQSFLLLLAIWLVVLLTAVGVGAAAVLITGDEAAAASAWVLVLANPAGFFAVTYLGWRLTGAPARDVFPLGPMRWTWLPPLVVVSVAVLVLAALADVWLRLLPQPVWWRELVQQVDQAMDNLLRQSPWGAAVAVLVIAPLTEELFFRGLVLRGLVLRRGVWPGILISSALFAIAHLTPNQLGIAFGTGVLLAWIVIRTRNLTVALVTHALVNGTALAVTHLADPPPGPAPLPDWWVAPLALALLAAGWLWLARVLPRAPRAAPTGPASPASPPQVL